MLVYVNKIGFYTPGITSWPDAVVALTDNNDYSPQNFEKITLTILQANERRRTTNLIKLALTVAQQVTLDSDSDLSQVSTVFAASDGDHDVIQRICIALTQAEHPVSPTIFHNSVHNAPAGYWAIAINSMQESTSLSASDNSFSAGLLEAGSIVVAENKAVLLIAYDFPPRAPMSDLRQVTQVFATSFWLTPEKTKHSLATINMELLPETEETQCQQKNWERLRVDNPAARSIPLLQLLANKQSGTVILPGVRNTALKLEIHSCL